jgi:tetratricopeptide (TPR) repeat protein
LALGILGDGLSESAVRELGNAGISDGPAQDLVAALADTPWWRGGRLIRLQPDRPAAALLHETLFDTRFPRGSDRLSNWLFVATQENASTFADRLGRILFDLDILDPKRSGPHPLDDRLIEMLRSSRTRAPLFKAATEREPPFHAGRFAAEVASILTSMVGDPAQRAGLLNNLANLLSSIGRWEEAVARGEEAVMLYRELARKQPERFMRDLATSLSNLAAMLSDLERNDEALILADESVALHRDLVRVYPESFAPYLAISLNTLAIRLAKVGRPAEALNLAEEAVALYRKLAHARPDAFTFYLAGSINNLANILPTWTGSRRRWLSARRPSCSIGSWRVSARKLLRHTWRHRSTT